MIVGDLGPGVADPGQKCGFAHIGKAYKPRVSDHFQFQGDPKFLAVLTWLSILGVLHGGGDIVHVAKSSFAAF